MRAYFSSGNCHRVSRSKGRYDRSEDVLGWNSQTHGLQLIVSEGKNFCNETQYIKGPNSKQEKNGRDKKEEMKEKIRRKEVGYDQ